MILLGIVQNLILSAHASTIGKVSSSSISDPNFFIISVMICLSDLPPLSAEARVFSIVISGELISPQRHWSLQTAFSSKGRSSHFLVQDSNSFFWSSGLSCGDQGSVFVDQEGLVLGGRGDQRLLFLRFWSVVWVVC